MYLADREYGLPKLINTFDLKVGIEIGVRHGTFSKHILENSRVDKLYSLDCFPYPGMLEMTRANLTPFGDRSEIIIGYSPQESNKFADNSLDFIYIDANHTYEAVLNDLKSWWPKLKDGGLFMGDDYTFTHNPGEGEYGVVQAVDEFTKDFDVPVYVTGVNSTDIKEKHRMARGAGKIIEFGLKNPGTFVFGTSTLEDDIRIPNWYTFKD